VLSFAARSVWGRTRNLLWQSQLGKVNAVVGKSINFGKVKSAMIILVLIFNAILAAMCFYIAWQLWLWRQALAQVADALIDAERVTHEVLNGAPEGILQGQIGSHQLRQSYRQLDSQRRQVQKLLGFLSFGTDLLGRRSQRRPLRP
jgi:hypothetical protein